MVKVGRLLHAESGRELLSRVRWCASYDCKLRGLMFRRALEPGEGLLMVEPRANRTGTAIHMLFVSFTIAVVWLDDHLCVVDKVCARPWRLAYAPSVPARYTLEADVALLDRVDIGDCLVFEDAS